MAPVEEIGHRLARDRVRLVFETIDLDREPHQVLEILERVDRLLDLDAALGHDVGQFLRLGRRARDLEQHEPGADRLDRVQHVVQSAREVVDVLALERGDECPIQALEQFVRHEIALVFGFLELAGPLFEPVELRHHLAQLVAAEFDERALLAEQGEEVLFAWEQREHVRLAWGGESGSHGLP